jgi:hypothetical protein
LLIKLDPNPQMKQPELLAKLGTNLGKTNRVKIANCIDNTFWQLLIMLKNLPLRKGFLQRKMKEYEVLSAEIKVLKQKVSGK